MSSDSDRVSFGEILEGMTADPLDPGAKPTFAFVLVKFKIDGEDGESWGFRTSGPPNREELLGALSIQTALVRKGLLDEWDLDDDDDDDDD